MRLLTSTAAVVAFLGCNQSNENIHDDSATNMGPSQEITVVEGYPYVEIGYSYYENVYDSILPRSPLPG